MYPDSVSTVPSKWSTICPTHRGTYKGQSSGYTTERTVWQLCLICLKGRDDGKTESRFRTALLKSHTAARTFVSGQYMLYLEDMLTSNGVVIAGADNRSAPGIPVGRTDRFVVFPFSAYSVLPCWRAEVLFDNRVIKLERVTSVVTRG